jgi:hypothetical protein
MSWDDIAESYANLGWGVGGEGGRASAARSGDPLIGKSGDRKITHRGTWRRREQQPIGHTQECLWHRNAERLELAAVIPLYALLDQMRAWLR